MWEHAKEDLSECSGRKRDGLYQSASFYKKGVVKLKGLLVELIETLDQPLTVNINWKDMVVLGFPFHRIL